MMAPMFMSRDVISVPNVATTSSMSKTEVRELESEGWWKPLPGYLVEPRTTGSSRLDTLLAYIAVLSVQHPETTIFAGLTAAMLLGHPVWPEVRNIDLYKSKGRRNVREFSRDPYSPSPLYVRPMKMPTHITRGLTVGQGIRVTSLEQTAVDVARLAESESAFVTVCSILGRLATSGDVYTDRNDASFVEREEAARTRMMALVEKLSKTGGQRRAKEIISRASGQVESVAEARVLWIIHAFGLPLPTLQYRIMVEGHEYFGDFVWRDRMVIVEFNGEGKYGDDSERGRRFAREKARESLLRSAGYEIVNLSWKQLDNPEAVARLIHKFLRRGGRTVLPATIATPSANRELLQRAKPFRAPASSRSQRNTGRQ